MANLGVKCSGLLAPVLRKVGIEAEGMLAHWLLILAGCLVIVMTAIVAGKRLRQLRSRAERAGQWPTESGGATPAQEPATARKRSDVWTAFAAQLPLRAATLQELHKELRRAGYYGPSALERFNALRFLMVVGSLFGFALLALFLPDPLTLATLLLGGLAALLGFSLPRLLVQMQGRNRVRRVLRGLPDAIDLINLGVSHGLTFTAALAKVSSQIQAIHSELSEELQIVCRQADMHSLEHALEQMAERLDSPEIRNFADTLTHSERLGTGLSGALSTFAQGLRTSARQQAERALSAAPFKLLFPIVLCLVPAVILILLGPALIELDRFMRQNQQILRVQPLNLPRIQPPGQ